MRKFSLKYLKSAVSQELSLVVVVYTPLIPAIFYDLN